MPHFRTLAYARIIFTIQKWIDGYKLLLPQFFIKDSPNGYYLPEGSRHDSIRVGCVVVVDVAIVVHIRKVGSVGNIRRTCPPVSRRTVYNLYIIMLKQRITNLSIELAVIISLLDFRTYLCQTFVSHTTSLFRKLITQPILI